MSFKDVMDLRRSGRLNEAYRMAIDDLKEERTEWSLSALFWVLNDICKSAIVNTEIDKAKKIFNDLEKVFNDMSDFEGYAQKALTTLRRKFDADYELLQNASELSKNGDHSKALGIFQEIHKKRPLHIIHHESFGWIIYRYLSKELENLSSLEVRTLLRDYMNLENERPSRLHSLFVNFAAAISEKFDDFRLLPFVKLWGVSNFTYEDYHSNTIDDKEIKPLVARLLQKMSLSKEYSATEVIDVFNASSLNIQQILDYLREPYYWEIYKASKNGKAEIWKIYAEYNHKFRDQKGSSWHSKILESAYWNMKDQEEWRFLHFFIEWGQNNFTEEDWQSVKKEEHTYDPLVLKTIDKLFEGIKSTGTKTDLEPINKLIEEAVKKHPRDYQLLRKQGLLFFWMGKTNEAISIYKTLTLSLDDWYVWHEFSKLFIDDIPMKVALLSKALLIQPAEDFIGDVRLEIAECLIQLEYKDQASFELSAYYKHRIEKGWKVAEKYTELKKNVDNVEPSKSNKQFYKENSLRAERFAYGDLPFEEMVLISIYQTKEGKKRMKFINDRIDVSISANKFDILKNATLGEVFNVKLHKESIDREMSNRFHFGLVESTQYKYKLLFIERSSTNKWGIFPISYGFVEYVNIEKKVVHIITSDSQQAFYHTNELEFTKGDYVTFKSYIETVQGEKRIGVQCLQKCNKNIAIKQFRNKIVVVDEVNENKELFHYVMGAKLLTGIAHFDKTPLRPQVGDFLSVYYYVRKDKDSKKRLETLQIEPTDEQRDDLLKEVNGFLELKYKGNNDDNQADFGFISNYYVPKSVLLKHNITKNLTVAAKAVFDGERWRVFEIL